MSRQAQKIVYLLGAGFSKAVAGLPTMNRFLRDQDLTKETYPHMDRFIKNFFKGSNFGLEEKGSNLNLEEIFTYIEMGLSEFGEKMEGSLRTLEKARKELENYVAKRLDGEFHDKRKHNKDFNKEYEGYVEKLRKLFENSYAILTLNYDLIIDGVLRLSDCAEMVERLERLLEINEISDKKLVKEFSENILLKLHGSLDWLCCSNFKCPFTLPRSPLEQKVDAIKIDPFPEKKPDCEICERPLSRLIIPPSLHKSSDKFNPLILKIWKLAKEVLLRADKIVIIGVSFAESDYHLKWLFKSAIAERRNNLPRIEVVNKDACVCNKVKDITGITPEFEMSLDKHLISQTAEND